jgi:hypothetical protein
MLIFIACNLDYVAPQQPPPAPQAVAPGHMLPVEHAGLLDILPMLMPPTRDMSFSVFWDLQVGQGSVVFETEWTISSNTVPHCLHSNS